MSQIMSQLAAALLAGLALAPACESEPPPVDFNITLDFASPPDSPWQCPSTSCEELEMRCDGKLSIRVVDARDPAVLHGDECVTVPGMSTMCELRNVKVPLSMLPAGQARIELALWDEDSLPDGACPAQPIFDLQGYPLTTVSPQPVVAGAIYFDIGSSRTARIPLSCPDLTPINRDECLPQSIEVEIIDLDEGKTLQQTDPLTDQLTVRYGLPQFLGGQWMLTNLQVMTPSDLGDAASWVAALGTPVPEQICVQVTASEETTPVVSCFALDTNPDRPRLQALYLSQTTIRALLAAKDLTSVEAGLVAGRVLQAQGGPFTSDLPLAGMVVETEPADVAVEYLTPALDDTGPTATTSSGYFLATEAPFPAAWSAVQGAGSLMGSSIHLGGIIAGNLTVVRIEVPAAGQ